MEAIRRSFKRGVAGIGVGNLPIRTDGGRNIAASALLGNVKGVGEVTNLYVIQQRDLSCVTHAKPERWPRSWATHHIRKRIWPNSARFCLIVGREVTHLPACASRRAFHGRGRQIT